MTSFYRHYKKKEYQIVGEALDTRDDSLVVVYRTLYSCEYSLFTRPKEVFFGTVTHADGTSEPRFAPVLFAELTPEAQAHVLRELKLPQEVLGEILEGRKSQVKKTKKTGEQNSPVRKGL